MGTRRDELEFLKGFVEGADLRDDAVYAEVVRRVVSGLEMPPLEVADALMVSRPTISRWMNGVTAPHPRIREPIRRFAIDHIRRILRRIDIVIE